MEKVVGKRKRRVEYRDVCLAIDIVRVVTTVRTFSKETWINCWDGRFARLTDDGERIDRIALLHELYLDIQTAAKKDIIVARKDESGQTLRWLEKPYVIARRK